MTSKCGRYKSFEFEKMIKYKELIPQISDTDMREKDDNGKI